jgi:hypothetical protein
VITIPYSILHEARKYDLIKEVDSEELFDIIKYSEGDFYALDPDSVAEPIRPSWLKACVVWCGEEDGEWLGTPSELNEFTDLLWREIIRADE